MRAVVVSRFLAFISIIHRSESLNWTVHPTNPTLVTKGKDESLTWEFNLTADELTASQTFYLIKWRKFNHLSSVYDQIASKTFLSSIGRSVYDEPKAPKIKIDRNDPATLLINNFRREDEGTYKIEYSLQADGTVLADYEVTVTVLERPKIVHVSTDQDVCLGSMVTLSCNATGKPAPNITWMKEGENGTNSGALPSEDGFYVIRNISRGFSGTYRCTASNGVGDSVNQTAKVIIGNSPSVESVVTSPNTAVEGNPYNLSCEVSGVPLSSVSWIKVSNGDHHAGKLLNFTNISRNDAGKYTCKASNRCGKDFKTEAINVFFKPVITQFKTSVANHTVCQNDVIHFNCTADANPPVMSYLLFENETAIMDTDTPGIWSRNMSTRGVFMYKCLANNTYGTGISEMILVRVYDPPFVQDKERKIVKEGDNISLYCNASGIPAPIVSWRKVESDDDIANGHSLNISDISRCQGGEYRCTVRNTCGTASGTVDIDVQYGPYIVSSKRQIVKEGHCVTLSCPVLGNPPPDITWYKGDNIGAVISNKNVLQFPLASMDVSGWYTCLATSYIGNVTSSVFLEIEKSVESTTITSRITTSSVSNNCQCSCNDVSLKAIIGLLAFIIIVLLLCIVWLYKKGTTLNRRNLEHERDVYDNKIALNDLEPGITDSSTFTQPRAEYMDLKETGPDRSKSQSDDKGADYAPLHPSTRSWEVDRDHVTIEKMIGKGAFGQVAKGTAVELPGRPGTTTVAIKMLKLDAAQSDKRDLMKELETMKRLKPHPYVIKLLGCVTESEPLLVLIEYVPYGDLLGYLRKSRGLNDTYFKDPDIKPQTNLTSQQLMKFAWQIADGMTYLSSKSIIHRDLAARNVLVGERETCKVTDFGMARNVEEENVYERKTKGRLPVKWTAYEALLYGTYTTKSDIWSYGVVLYEIFTIGGSPYPRMDGRKIATLLQEGHRMPKPQHVDDKLYQIMMRCWQEDPDARPSFTDLRNQLKGMETLHKRLINMKMYDEQLYANLEDLVV